ADVCREAAAAGVVVMTDERDVLKELSAALDVQPSPEFAARVRERVASAPRAHWSWMWIALGTGVPAATVALISLRGPVQPVVQAPTVLASAPVAVVEPVGPKPAPSPHVVERAPAPVRVLPVRATSSAEPEVLVPDDERIALNRLLLAMRQGRAAVPAPGN